MTTWLQHVKQVHASGSTSFKESLRRASASWKKQKKGAKPKKSKAPRKKKAAEKSSTDEPEAAAPIKKKRRKRAKRAMPKIPAEVYKRVDSRNL